MTEFQIRDKIIQNIQLINPCLIHVEKEKFFSHPIATNSFIDIFARSNDKYVIIEVKKSKATSREAIHELLKYVESVKINKSCNSEDIELIIISSDWDELLIPYSVFVSHVDYAVLGYKITSLDAIPEFIPVKPVQISGDRMLSTFHMVRLYSSECSLKNGIADHKEYFKKIYVDNFILIILEAPEGYHELEVEACRSMLYSLIGSNDINVSEIPNLPYMIYSSNQLLPLEQYRQLLFGKDEVKEEFEEIYNDNEITIPEKLEKLNELLLDSVEHPDCDHVEIGYPAKYLKIRDDEGWVIRRILKFGALSTNELLTDDIIENEIMGGSGTAKNVLNAKFDFSNKASVNRFKANLSACLVDNAIWKNHILDVLCLLENDGAGSVTCEINNPMNILYSIYLTLSKENGFLYSPSYIIHAKYGKKEALYCGYVDGIIQECGFIEIVNKYFDSITGFTTTLLWGGYNKHEFEICNDIGLKYKSMCVIKEDDVSNCYEYLDYKFVKTNMFHPQLSLYNVSNKPNRLVKEIMEFFEKNSQGGLVIIQ